MKRTLLLIAFLSAFTITKAQDNNALQITDGISYFWCPAFYFFSTADLTIEAWIKLDETEIVDDYTAVVDGRYGGTGGSQQKSKALIFKTINDILTLGYEWEGAWGFEDTDGLSEVQRGEWQHVAMVVDGTAKTTTFYVDGYPGAVHSPTSSEPTEYGNVGNEISWDTLFVGGGNTDPARTIIGLIDEIRVWSVARTASEIVNNMTHEIEPNDNLLAYYRCNESPGDTILTDISGWENHAVVRNRTETSFTFVPLTDEDWYIVTSVEKNDLEDVSLYPNPVKDILNFKGVDVINTEIRIFNLVGQLVENTIVHNSSLDISNLNSGVYFIEIKKDNQTFCTKLCKE